jgi:chromosome partitioning protein
MSDIEKNSARTASGHPPDGVVVSVCNGKGGVGKTAMVKTLGVYLAKRKGMQVLVIDMDPQSNLTLSMGVLPGADVRGIGDILTSEHIDSDWVRNGIMEIKYGGVPMRVHLLPGSHATQQALDAMSRAAGRNVGIAADMTLRLRRVVDMLRPYYDLILIDTPSTPDAMVIDLACMAADGVLIPATDASSLGGVHLVLDRLQCRIGDLREDLEMPPLAGWVVAARTHRISRASAMPWFPQLNKLLPCNIMRTAIRQSEEFARAFGSPRPYGAISGSVSHHDYIELTDEFLARLQHYQAGYYPITEALKSADLTDILSACVQGWDGNPHVRLVFRQHQERPNERA